MAPSWDTTWMHCHGWAAVAGPPFIVCFHKQPWTFHGNRYPDTPRHCCDTSIELICAFMALPWPFHGLSESPNACHGLFMGLRGSTTWDCQGKYCYGIPGKFHDPAHCQAPVMVFQDLPTVAIALSWATVGLHGSTTGLLWIAMTLLWHCHRVSMELPCTAMGFDGPS